MEGMSINQRVELMGAPGSPYSRKMIALLRYRQIPHSVFWNEQSIPSDYPKPRIPLLPTLFLRNPETGERDAATDSTPLIRRFERETPERSVIPSDPVVSLLNDLIEDYGDEWLTKAMFHFRWAHQEDAENAAPLLVFWNTNTLSDADAEAFASMFSKRQIDRLFVVGSNEVTAQTIEASFTRLIETLDELIAEKGFIFGGRPSSADFAIYGQLTQLAIVEPTSATITSNISQRVRAWVDLMDDLSGVPANESDWITRESAKTTLGPLLKEIGRTYVPAMLANAKAIAEGKDNFETEIDGRSWTQPVFKYQMKCVEALRQTYSELDVADRSDLDEILAGSGCEALYAAE
jgi:glutathione S-transferase